jgi:hypothetical protein
VTAVSDTTFYTCIESGRLEPEVLVMVATLRAFGGRFAQCPVLAIQPRAGPPVARQTQRELERLGVQYLHRPLAHRFDWLGFTCKPLAAEMADAAATTKHIAWLDGDVFVVREPAALDARENDDIEVLGCAEELGPVSTGPGSAFEPFWAALAQGAGLRIDDIPLVTAGPSGKPMRLHINSGVFRFGRGSGFAQRYRELYDRLLALRVVPKADPSIFLHEQIIFSVAAASWRGGLRLLDPTYNFHAEPMYEALYPPGGYAGAVLLHWHGSLRMDDFADTFVARLREQLPAVAAVVQPHLPLAEPPAFVARLRRAALRRWRRAQEAWFTRGVIAV